MVWGLLVVFLCVCGLFFEEKYYCIKTNDQICVYIYIHTHTDALASILYTHPRLEQKKAVSFLLDHLETSDMYSIRVC